MTALKPPLSMLDQKALDLLIFLRNNPKIQQDQALLEVFNNAVSFMTASSGSSAVALPFATSQIIQSIDKAATPVSTTTSSLVPFLRIDTSGEDGDNGFHGMPGPSLGGKGLNGTDGTHGKNACDIHLQLSVIDEAVIAQWNKKNIAMKLGDSSVSIFLKAIGGNGGNGGNGGKGGTGTTGAHGQNADRYADGTNGKRGMLGGPGGQGGDGGNGGKGGDVKVYVGPQDSDLLMLLEKPLVTGGNKGKGGLPGKGGAGGKGGKGGDQHTYVQPPLGYSYTNRGGADGPQGLDGIGGRKGEDGKPGVNGSFQMIVGGVSYQSLYDLAISVSKIVDLTKGNPADIYEPGELVNLRVTVSNTGGMPTPSQDIHISLLHASWIEPSNISLVLKAHEILPTGGAHTLSGLFSFHVKDLPSPTEEPLHKQEALSYQAVLCRVNKAFSSVSQQKDLFAVRYPVQISSLTGKIETSSSDKKLALSLSIQNVGSISVGKATPQERRIFVTFEISEGKDLLESHQKTVEIDKLSSKSEEKIDASIPFTNSDRQVRSKINVIASLHLGCFSSENHQMLKQAKCIQINSAQIQPEEDGNAEV